MYLIETIINLVIILLLVRLLINPREAHFNQIFSLLFRITDPLLIPAKSLTRNDVRAILLSVLFLVLLRGLSYIFIKPIPFISGVGSSFLSLFQLLFQFYMVVWFVSILTRHSYGSSFISMVQRAFLPLSALSSRIGIPRQHFSLFSFLSLLILYSLLSYILHNIIGYGVIHSGFSFFHGLCEGSIFIIGLFPGFFSLVIIVGALLSWVNPDPYNPVVETIYGISEPLLTPFRKLVPNFGGLDISPIIALLCFQFLGRFLQKTIVGVMGII